LSALTLKLATMPDQRLDLSPLTPAGLAGLEPKAIEALIIGTNRAPLTVGDVFKLKGTDAAKLRLVGTTAGCDRIGHGLKEGEITIDGDAGAYLGAFMKGGKIVLTGSAGPWAGAAMAKGSIEIGGDAGERAGGVAVGELWGMRGGRLVIGGKAGAMLGERMRRGLIIVGRGADDYAGARMIAGTIMIKGRVGHWAGYGLRRGSLILDCMPEELLPTFNDCGTLDFNWLRLLWRTLHAEGVPVKFGARARRLMGDMAAVGKGEMLILA
jgi:formylmethanofuran dehydrogenase subunit C